MTSVMRAAIWVGSAPDDQERLSPARTGRLPATVVAALVMRIVIVIGVVFIFLKTDQVSPRWLSDINPYQEPSIAGKYHFRILLRRCSVTR